MSTTQTTTGLSVTVDRGQRERKGRKGTNAATVPNFAQAAEANEEVTAAIRARRRAVHDQHAGGQAAATAAAAEEKKPPAEPFEDLESIEFALPNGLQIVLGPPAAVSLTMRVLLYYNDQASWAIADEQVTRALMCVRSIDGKPAPPVTNPVERAMLGNRLGDAGIAICVHFHRKHWPIIRTDQLPVIKKNQRGV